MAKSIKSYTEIILIDRTFKQRTLISNNMNKTETGKEQNLCILERKLTVPKKKCNTTRESSENIIVKEIFRLQHRRKTCIRCVTPEETV